jgi:hypothetical protein
MSYAEQQAATLVPKLADAQLQVRRLDSDLQSLVHRLNGTTRHRDELLVELFEMTSLVERLQLVIGNVTIAHAEIARRVDAGAVDPQLVEAVRNLGAALRGHFIDD